jgi:hypothetical protein
MVQMQSLFKIEPPPGGRIHIIRVSADPRSCWQKTINVCGPNTGDDWDIRMVDVHYPIRSGNTEEREIILVNFGKSIPNGQYALDWAKQLCLSPVDPRKVFAIGEHKPKLHLELGVGEMVVVSLIPCSFDGCSRVPYVWWEGLRRSANLDFFDSEFDDGHWFAFVPDVQGL